MFLFDYIGIAYCRNNDATPLDLLIHIILYYSSLIKELSMENNWKTILTIKILRKYVIRRHREEKEWNMVTFGEYNMTKYILKILKILAKNILKLSRKAFQATNWILDSLGLFYWINIDTPHFILEFTHCYTICS